jgi:hypothetical protein
MIKVSRPDSRPAVVEPNTNSLLRCDHALELLLTHRGNPSVEIERVLVDDPQCVFGQHGNPQATLTGCCNVGCEQCQRLIRRVGAAKARQTSQHSNSEARQDHQTPDGEKRGKVVRAANIKAD